MIDDRWQYDPTKIVVNYRFLFLGGSSNEPRSKLPAIDFSIRWNLFFKKLNGVTRAQAFHKLRASSCTRKLRASPKSRKHFKHKFKSKLIYNEKGYTTWWLLWRKPTFEQSVGFGLGLQELLREFRASFAQAKGFLATMPPATGSKMIVDSQTSKTTL